MSVPSGLVLSVSLAMWNQPAGPDASAPFELVWSAPAECPVRDEARGAIERHFGRAIAGELGEGVRVDVVVERDGDDGWRATIGFDGPRGRTTRELVVATDCERAVDAAALVIAIAIDPALARIPELPAEAVPEPPPPAPEDAQDTLPREDVPPEPAARGVAAPPPIAELSRGPRSIRGAIGLVAGPSFGDLARTSGLARLYGAVSSRRWRVEIGATFSGAPTLSTNGARVSMQRVVGDVRGCATLDPRPWLELTGCGGIEAGVTFARADGLTTSQPRRDAWVGLLLAPRIGFVVRPRLALVVGADVVAPLLRLDYTVVGIGRVHQTAPVTGAVVAGLEVRFP